MKRLLNKLLEKSTVSIDDETVKVWLGDYVFIWKDSVYIGYHKVK